MIYRLPKIIVSDDQSSSEGYSASFLFTERQRNQGTKLGSRRPILDTQQMQIMRIVKQRDRSLIITSGRIMPVLSTGSFLMNCPSQLTFRPMTVGILLAAFGLCHADTSALREMARNVPSIYVLYSGEKAHPFASRIVQEIKDFREQNRDKKKQIIAVNVQEAEKLAKQKDFEKQTTIVVVDDEDNIQMEPTAAIAYRLPKKDEERTSSAKLHTLVELAGRQVFSVILQAPDTERLDRVTDYLLKTSARDYKHLDFDQHWRSNKLVVHSNVNVNETWGEESGAWNYVTHATLNDQQPSPEPSSEFDYAYLVDQSKSCDNLPAEILARLQNASLKQGTAFATKYTLPNGHIVAILTAPNDHHLELLSRKFRKVDAIPSVDYKQTLPDLRFLAGQGSVVKINLGLSGQDDKQITNALTEYMGSAMRHTGIKVLERGMVLNKILDELSIEDLMGRSSSRQRFRLKTQGVRYVWYLSVTNVSRRTKFVGDKTAVGDTLADPGPAPEEPVKESYESWDNFRARHAKWESEMGVWRNARQRYDFDVPVNWHLSIERVQTTELEVQFKLFDLAQEAGTVTWETQVVGTSTDRSTLSDRDVVVNGHRTQPDSPQTPPAEPTCETSVALSACRDAADKSQAGLADTSWVSGAPVAPFISASSIGLDNSTVQSLNGSVLAVTTTAILIDLTELDGVTLGDTVKVKVGQVTATFKVVSWEPKTKCTPIDTNAKALLAKIRKGTPLVLQRTRSTK